MATMLLDHIGLIFFPEIVIFRLIGRLALPLYAFLISEGMRYTSSRKKYFTRLFYIALISQFIYVFVIDWKLNIIFGLFLGALSIYFIEKKKYFLLPIVLFLPIIIPTDYTIFGVILPIIFYFFNTKWIQIIYFSIISCAMLIYYEHYMPIFHIFALFVIYFTPFFAKEINIKNTWITSSYFNNFYRFFYPGHLFLLFVIQKIIG